MPPVTIRAIAGGGDGVGTLADGRTVFVPRTAPGDVIELAAVRTQARFARARIGSIVEHSPDRVVPPCPHYVRDECGGCQLMHIGADAQRRIKATIAGDAMRRLARLPVDDPSITPSPQQLHYRSKMTLGFQRGVLGYHRLGAPDRLFELHECLLVEPGVSALHAAVRRVKRLLPAATSRVVFRRDREHGYHVMVQTTGTDAWTGGRQLHAASGVNATMWWQPERGAPRAVAGSLDAWPATVFEQVHPAMGVTVRQHALTMLGAVQGRRVWDLYAGIGETTAALAQGGALVESVELDRRAVELANRLGPDGPRRLAGSVEASLGDLKPPQLVITNPPRTGMAAESIEQLVAAAPERVVYISCDPATLARDLGRMQETYRLTSLQAFDQFPQTAHLESVAVLDRFDGAATG